MYPACLSDVCEDGNYFLKLTRAQLKSRIVALDVSGSRTPAIDIKQIIAFVAKEFSHKGRQSFF